MGGGGYDNSVAAVSHFSFSIVVIYVWHSTRTQGHNTSVYKQGSFIPRVSSPTKYKHLVDCNVFLLAH